MVDADNIHYGSYLLYGTDFRLHQDFDHDCGV